MTRLITGLFALVLMAGCQKEDGAPVDPIRVAAWNYLTPATKQTVTVDWTKAPMAPAVYNQKNAISVSFKTSMDALLGPITVYVDPDTKVVLGQALRD
jgi:hypothetical protein